MTLQPAVVVRGVTKAAADRIEAEARVLLEIAATARERAGGPVPDAPPATTEIFGNAVHDGAILAWEDALYDVR